MPNWEHEWGGNREHGRRARPNRSPADSGNNKSCCFGAAAVKAARRGKYRLAGRYSRLMVVTLARRAVAA